MIDPFGELGLRFDAPLEEIRAARRQLARTAHPDHGGDEDTMKRLNAAFDAAVAHATGRRLLFDPSIAPSGSVRGATGSSSRHEPVRRRPSRVAHDHPSFTVDALPAEAFEALVIVANWIGKVLVDEPPYLLDVHLYEPAECWCRLELVPDAGASTVSVTVASADDDPNPGVPVPDVEDVRDVWVAQLNRLGADEAEWPSS